ncbi:hypothetical protein [Pseudoduganella ginsengisoli]|uniref:Uncharacterized protein n=1 Tax=Pseudoduganella ginsengisoli TaxID=1462440 RepID=A0A6L6Q4L4_9BURK|nr:hypothetical protein [Pseudoduganella ginsengisoli]MTW04369.1 hypothetical protein [Pseudoduganella ginsengisoli]
MQINDLVAIMPAPKKPFEASPCKPVPLDHHPQAKLEFMPTLAKITTTISTLS